MRRVRDATVFEIAKFWILFAISLSALLAALSTGFMDWNWVFILFLFLYTYHRGEAKIQYSHQFFAFFIFLLMSVAFAIAFSSAGYFAVILLLITVPGLFHTRPVRPLGGCAVCSRAILWPYLRRDGRGRIRVFCKECHLYLKMITNR